MKRGKLISIMLAALLASISCVSILEGDMRSESPHKTTVNERPPEEQFEVTNYIELKNVLLDLIGQHEASGLILIYRYDRAIQEDIDLVIGEILSSDPIAIYAVAEIDATVTRIVSLFEIDVKIEYKRTKEQVASIVNVSTHRYLRTELLSSMSDYREEAVYLMSMQISEAEMYAFIQETYYQNPRSIVIMPVAVVETITTNGDIRLIELRFSNIEQASMLQQYVASLIGSVRLNALAASGDNDAEILLSLAQNLINACDYDENTARTISEHGVQNLSATAYSALVRGTAVGEGIAMAFKALCDELGFDCRVVLGYLEGMVHAWNIVLIDGHYYHVDVAMCALNGLETAFLKTDADFADSYFWDAENSVICDGELTYQDIISESLIIE